MSYAQEYGRSKALPQRGGFNTVPGVTEEAGVKAIYA